MEKYQVKLGIYSGPLDLLLYLVRQHEVDIENIDVADITEQYLAFLDLIRELDMDFAADFLVTAATLMLIKVRSALPVEEVSLDDDEDEADPRMELIRQLMEYKKYRDAATLLAERADEHEMHVPRRGVIDAEPTSVEDMLRDVSLWDLMKAFQKVLSATGADAERIVMIDDQPVSHYMEELQGLLARAPGKRVSFSEAFAGKRARYDLIGLFLAILELARLKRICIVQKDHHSEIEIALTSVGETPLSQEERRLVEVAGGGDVAGGGEGAVAEEEVEAPGATIGTLQGTEEESEGETRDEEGRANNERTSENDGGSDERG